MANMHRVHEIDRNIPRTRLIRFRSVACRAAHDPGTIDRHDRYLDHLLMRSNARSTGMPASPEPQSSGRTSQGFDLLPVDRQQHVAGFDPSIHGGAAFDTDVIKRCHGFDRVDTEPRVWCSVRPFSINSKIGFSRSTGTNILPG